MNRHIHFCIVTFTIILSSCHSPEHKPKYDPADTLQVKIIPNGKTVIGYDEDPFDSLNRIYRIVIHAEKEIDSIHFTPVTITGFTSDKRIQPGRDTEYVRIHYRGKAVLELIDLASDSIISVSCNEIIMGAGKKYTGPWNRQFIFMGNVCMHMSKGDTLHCDSLQWETASRRLIARDSIRIVNDRQIITGKGFNATFPELKQWSILEMKGIYILEKP